MCRAQYSVASFAFGLVFSVASVILPVVLTPTITYAYHPGPCVPSDPPGSQTYSGSPVLGLNRYYCYSPGDTIPSDMTPYGSPVEARNPKCAEYAGFGYFYNFSDCFGKDIAIFLATGIIWITGWFLSFAAIVFNFVSMYTIGEEFATLYGMVAPAIQVIWSVFRDVANIVIIGVLTFVAIEMILGTQTFGGRKTVAKVLLIAILINFSLLFSRLIIHSSNFLAVQFYKAMNLTPEGSTTASPLSASIKSELELSAGISGKFAQAMGLGGTLRTDQIIKNIAENPEKGGWMALLHGLFTGAIFVAAGVVMLYLCYLLVARFTVLIFAAMFSSLAFATYIVPKSFLQGYDWDYWWETILKAAVFAPLLIMLLWATLKVAESLSSLTVGNTVAAPKMALSERSGALAAAGSVNLLGPDALPARDSLVATVAEAADAPAPAGSGKTIGDLVTNPAQPGGLLALLSYGIILAMLIATGKIATAFSTSIGGFNYAKMLQGNALSGIFRGAGILGRGVLGGSAAWEARRQSKFQSEYQAKANDPTRWALTRAWYGKQAELAGKAKVRAEERSKRTYDLGSTTRGGQLLGFLGAKKDLPFVGYGGKPQSVYDRDKHIIDEVSKAAASMAKLSDTAKDLLKEKAAAKADTDHALTETTLKKQRDDALTNLNTARTTHEDAIRDATIKRKNAEEDAAAAERAGNTAAAAAAKSTMKAEEARIERAQTELARHRATYEKAAGNYTTHTSDAGKESFKKDVKDAFMEAAEKSVAEHAKKYARNAVDREHPVANFFSANTLANRAAGEAVESFPLNKDDKQKKWWKDLLGKEIGGVKDKIGSK